MKVIKVADDGTVTLELTAAETRDVRNDVNAADWDTLTDSAKALYHFLDMVRAPEAAGRAGIFPGGGF
jgi:hypothetical protein